MAETLATMLARVRAALGRPRADCAPPAVPDGLVRIAAEDVDATALFLANAAGVGMVAEGVEARHAARRVLEILCAQGVRRVGVDASLGELESGLRAAGILIDGSDALYETGAGITGAQAGLAETGTLVLRGDCRLSLVPPLHIALLRAEDILPDMLDYFRGDPKPTGPRVFVTGPSKTADIEGELITGVHGPGRVHVLVILAGDQEDDRRVVEQVHEHAREEAVAAGA